MQEKEKFDKVLARQVARNRRKWNDAGKSTSLFLLIAEQQIAQLRNAILYPTTENIAEEAVHVAAMMQEIWERASSINR